MRTEAAFLISIKRKSEVVVEMTIKSEAGGALFVKLPFPTWLVKGVERSEIKVVQKGSFGEKGIAEIKTVKGQIITFTNAFE